MTRSELRKLEWQNPDIRARRLAGRKGYKHSEETKLKISIANTDNPKRVGKHHSPTTEFKKGNPSKGKTFKRGEKPWNWQGGNDKRNERHILMGRIEYRQWRTAVFERDNYTCQMCGKKGGKLEADHIKPWSLFPELRYVVDNGRTLCKDPCHKLTDTWGYKAIQMADGLFL